WTTQQPDCVSDALKAALATALGALARGRYRDRDGLPSGGVRFSAVTRAPGVRARSQGCIFGNRSGPDRSSSCIGRDLDARPGRRGVDLSGSRRASAPAEGEVTQRRAAGGGQGVGAPITRASRRFRRSVAYGDRTIPLSHITSGRGRGSGSIV